MLAGLLRAFESNLHRLAFLVEIDVRNVAPVERKILLPHRVRVQSLVHACTWLLLSHVAGSA